MKKLLVLMLAITLVLTLAACGGSSGGTPLQDFLDEDGAEIQAEFDALAPMLGLGEGARVVLSANDANNELIFSFYFGEFDDLDEDELAAVSEMISDVLSPLLQPMAVEIRDELEMDSIVLTIEFLTLGGDNILSTAIEA